MPRLRLNQAKSSKPKSITSRFKFGYPERLKKFSEFRPSVILIKPKWPRGVVAGFIVLIGVVSMLLVAEIFLARKITRSASDPDLSTNLPAASLPSCESNQLTGVSEALGLKLNRKWYLIGKEFIGRDPLDAELTIDTTLLDCAPRNLKLAYKITNTEISNEQKTTNQDAYKFSLDISSLGVGAYELSFDVFADEQPSPIFTQKLPFYISKPVYVAWTLDWDGYNFSDNYLNQIAQLADRAQRIPITHFFNPIYSISGGTLQRRGEYFAGWIKNRQAQFGDEVGLHIHMFYGIAEAAGVTPRSEPTWNSRGTGSDVPLSSYTLEEQRKIIAWGKQALEKQGFTSQTSFRAGGWFANLDTLKVMDEMGFKVESSGRTAYSLGNNLSGPWRLDAAAQPYYPCKNNQNAACSGNNAFKVMEIPNNGGESFRFSTTQLIDRFRLNFNGLPQPGHRMLNILSHPEWFNIDYPKMTNLFETIDQHLYATDKGPIVYTTVENIYQAMLVN